jgi:YihY family inner membrane protein
MSSASFVAETRHLTGDDAVAALRRMGLRTLLHDSFRRLRLADGFSHARSLAYLTSLVVIQALIGLVGIASVLHKGGLNRVIAETIHRAVPGPAGHVLTTAVTQAKINGAEHHYLAILIGVVGSLTTATTAMGQLERGVNRLYGLERDRPTRAKYTRALYCAFSAGSLTIIAFACLALGNSLSLFTHSRAVDAAWSAIRWPLGVVLFALAVTVLFRWTPNRRQPHLSWLAFGAATAVILWVLSTAALGLFLGESSSFGATYGPLAGVVALLLWSLFSSVSLLFGAAVAAELEDSRRDLRSG